VDEALADALFLCPVVQALHAKFIDAGMEEFERPADA
jgi:hypothetical protein